MADRPAAPSGTCLVTGGAGFIGCGLSSGLADRFDRVVALDNLHSQVHASADRPAALDDRVELVRGDVTVAADWERVLDEVRPEVVLHLAAETGTAQSLTEASQHTLVNVAGTGVMLDALLRHDVLPERIVLASSRAVYGEGVWTDGEGRAHYPGQRTPAMFEAGQWDFPGLAPVPFEASRTAPAPTSVYGATKLAQEHVLTAWCLATGVMPVILRLHNVYGPGQSLTNPHTGVVSFFAQTARARISIPVYEDGQVLRDFVFIDDAVAAFSRSLGLETSPRTVPFDVGSGQPVTILRVAELISEYFEAPSPVVTGRFRQGDVRAATCDIGATTAALDWKPQVLVEDGLRRLCAWVDAEAG